MLLRLIAATTLLAAFALAVPLGKSDPDKIRENFIKNVANNSNYAYLNNVAIGVQKKKALLQRKGAVDPEKELAKKGGYGIPFANQPLKDFLYEGDILLSDWEWKAVKRAEKLKKAGIHVQRKAGGKIELSGGQEGPDIAKWPHDRPVCFVFQGLDQNSQTMARSAFKWWSENSCLEWKEGCSDKPVMQINNQGGCWTHKGPDVQNSFRQGPDGKFLLPPFADTMPMSLDWDNCGGTWSTAAHEASHAMGMAHEMSRPDRDQFIDIDFAGLKKINADDQYDIAKTSDTLGTTYDYGSNMHYQAFLSTGGQGPKPDLGAKEKPYQHSMGSWYGPVFYDVYIINKYNDCIKSGASCQNEGFPHPRNPQKCYCPEGFAGDTCGERDKGQNGVTCGTEVEAKAEWQQLNIDGPDAPNRNFQNGGLPGMQYAERAAACSWWIKAPAGKTIELKVDSITADLPGFGCLQDCPLHGIEVKFGDMKRSGPRLCCAGHEKELGTVKTKGSLAIIRHWTLANGIKGVVSYRTSDTPPDSPQTPNDNCKDQTPNCAKNGFQHCENSKYANVMKRRCPKTCKTC